MHIYIVDLHENYILDKLFINFKLILYVEKSQVSQYVAILNDSIYR